MQGDLRQIPLGSTPKGKLKLKLKKSETKIFGILYWGTKASDPIVNQEQEQRNLILKPSLQLKQKRNKKRTKLSLKPSYKLST